VRGGEVCVVAEQCAGRGCRSPSSGVANGKYDDVEVGDVGVVALSCARLDGAPPGWPPSMP